MRGVGGEDQDMSIIRRKSKASFIGYMEKLDVLWKDKPPPTASIQSMALWIGQLRSTVEGFRQFIIRDAAKRILKDSML